MHNPDLLPPLLQPNLHTPKPPLPNRALRLRRFAYRCLCLASSSDNLAVHASRFCLEQDY